MAAIAQGTNNEMQKKPAAQSMEPHVDLSAATVAVVSVGVARQSLRTNVLGRMLQDRNVLSEEVLQLAVSQFPLLPQMHRSLDTCPSAVEARLTDEASLEVKLGFGEGTGQRTLTLSVHVHTGVIEGLRERVKLSTFEHFDLLASLEAVGFELAMTREKVHA